MRLLLSGIPGGGKTTIGNQLAEQYGFVHIDMEENQFAPAKMIRNDPGRFLDGLPPGDVVLSWGFGVIEDVDSIALLFRLGWRGVWFDGERHWFLRSFLSRRSSLFLEVAFYHQVISVIQAGVSQRWPWLHLNPFDDSGTFKADLAGGILRSVAESGEISQTAR